MLDMNLSVSIRMKPADSQPALYYVKHDYELGGVRASAPTPEVFRLEEWHFSEMIESWQWFCFTLLESNVQAFNGVWNSYRAFSNDHGVDLFRNYITGQRLDKPLPAMASLVCGGNVLAGREEGGYLIVETMDGNEPPPAGVTRVTHPWLIQVATICTTTKLSDGTYKVTSFPQLDGRDVLVPIVASRPVQIPLSNLVRLPQGSAMPSPYNKGIDQ